MEKLTLTERSEEIYFKLPKKFRSIVFNAILAKSVSSGIIIEELSNYLTQSELDEIAQSLNVELTIKKIIQKKPRKKVEPIVKDDSNLFIGFDD